MLKTLKQASSLFGFVYCILLLFFSIYRDSFDIFDRLLDNLNFFTLGLCWLFQIIVNTLAVYLRANKNEPLTLISIISGLYTMISTYLLMKYVPVNFYFGGFLSSYIFGLPVILKIYSNEIRKREL